METEKDPEELKKIFQELKAKDEPNLPSFDELMNRPWKKVRISIPVYKVAAAFIIIVTCGTIAYFIFHEQHQNNTPGPFADHELNDLYEQQALLSQWEE